jgi:hypothetical protein
LLLFPVAYWSLLTISFHAAWQGDKTEWHIASGVVYKSKKLAPDEMAAMVDRLCVAKHKVRSNRCTASGHAIVAALACMWMYVSAVQQPGDAKRRAVCDCM